MGGVVVPLMATVGINNKVTFLEKWRTSQFLEFKNSTGAYELDLSLVNDSGRAWREMHVKSDVFCSASIILPDKGARQINIGGWSSHATYGVRLYTPDGRPGVNGTNDWEENYNEVALQVQLSPFQILSPTYPTSEESLVYYRYADAQRKYSCSWGQGRQCFFSAQSRNSS